MLAMFLSMTARAAGGEQKVISLQNPGLWKADGLEARFDKGVVTLTGSGYLKLTSGILTPKLVGGYTRLLVDYYFDGGSVSDAGMVSRGFPQTSKFRLPRWAPLDITSPANIWFTYGYDLNLPEWDGGSDKQLEKGAIALSFIIQPGSLTRKVKMRNLRFVKDPFRIRYDWLKPFAPLTFRKSSSGTLKYRKEIVLQSLSHKPVKIRAAIGNRQSKFKPTVAPSTVTIKPGKEASFVFQARSAKGMRPLYSEEIAVVFIPDGRRDLQQTTAILLGAPAKLKARPLYKVKKTARLISQAGAALGFELRLPPGPVWWMGQGTLNRFAAMNYIDYDKFQDNSGKIHTGTRYSSGALHRRIIRHIQKLCQAYAATGELKYAERAADWFLLYARQGNDYEILEPLSEASSYLCPNNATYVQASVVMGPLMRALNLIWYSGALNGKEKREIRENLVAPRAMESMKINPGMTNMQDEINNYLFFAGVTTEDPNLMAMALFGSHGVQQKINLAFSPDGSTEESIAAGYHNVSVHVVVNTLKGIQSSGIETGLDLTKIEKAQTLMRKLAMPNGQVPNRGDCPSPTRVCKPQEAQELKSITFDHFGMTILREAQGPNAIYVALDHRPPATTHSHNDKLSIVIFGAGHIFGVDEGSLYNIDPGKSNQVPNWQRRSAWGHHSLVHNTITVDEKSQKLAAGHRLYFQGEDDQVQAVGAYTDTITRGVRFERHIAVYKGIIVMVDRLFSAENHTYDLAHHSFGAIRTDIRMKPVKQLGTPKTYRLPENVKRGVIRAKGRACVSWEQGNAGMFYQLLNVQRTNIQLYTATGWANVKYRLVRQEAPFLMARKKGKKATFLSVINFHGKTPAPISSYKLSANRCQVIVARQKIIFDFKNNKVTAKPAP